MVIVVKAKLAARLIDQPTQEELLQHRPFVASLARHLTSDEEAARDLAQDVWVETLRRPPQHDENLRGWFRTLARRSAIRRWRRDQQREDVERRVTDMARAEAEKREDGPGAAELQAFPDVSEEILKLDEPYRSIVLLRFYEDLAPTEIARRLERPLNTVKSQLRRALERLRTKLDSRYGDRTAWSGLLLTEALRLGVAPHELAPVGAAAASGTAAHGGATGATTAAESSAPISLGTSLALLRVLVPAAV